MAPPIDKVFYFTFNGEHLKMVNAMQHSKLDGTYLIYGYSCSNYPIILIFVSILVLNIT